MKVIVTAAVLLATVFFVSCNNGKDKIVIDQSLVDSTSLISSAATTTVPDTNLQKMVTMEPATPPNAAILPGAVAVPAATNTINLNTQSKNPALNISPATVQAMPAVNNGKMNPAHGQPGHRCDIAVGAPLNSKPASNVTTSAATPPVTANANINTQPAVQAVAPGMNPAHGQPGHRCDISVGAPLNSKPIAPTAPTPTTAPVNFTPAKVDSTKN